jgi:hypothetical protein
MIGVPPQVGNQGHTGTIDKNTTVVSEAAPSFAQRTPLCCQIAVQLTSSDGRRRVT